MDGDFETRRTSPDAIDGLEVANVVIVFSADSIEHLSATDFLLAVEVFEIDAECGLGTITAPFTKSSKHIDLVCMRNQVVERSEELLVFVAIETGDDESLVSNFQLLRNEVEDLGKEVALVDTDDLRFLILRIGKKLLEIGDSETGIPKAIVSYDARIAVASVFFGVDAHNLLIEAANLNSPTKLSRLS